MAATTKTRVFTCRDCPAYITAKEASYNGLCADCTQRHIDAWKAEHTRNGPSDKRKGWLIGDLCTVKLRNVKYDAKILDMSDRSDGDYLWTKLELTKTVQGLGNEITRTWIHPEPVQSYKLRKRGY